jgi:hypothetical protein
MMPPEARAADRRADALRRSLDRAVRTTRGVRLLAAGGCWLVAAGCLVAALAALDACSSGRLGLAALPLAARVAILVAAAGSATTLFLRRRIRRDGWPDRLAIAIATESRHPLLGETLSRAVGFLGERADCGRTAAASPATVALERLAVDQAADASEKMGGPVLPGLGVDLRAVAAGIGTVVALWLSTVCLPGRWSTAVQRQLVVAADRATPGRAPPSSPASGADGATAALPADVRRTGDQLARAAAVERRLADLLAARFAQAPGVPASALAYRSRHELDDFAAIQTDCARTIAAARDTLATAADGPHRDRLLAAIGRLDGAEVADADEAIVHIAANRLRLAAAAADRVAAVVADVATELGAGAAAAAGARAGDAPGGDIPLDPTHAGDAGMRPDGDRSLARAVATIARFARDADHPREAVDRAAVDGRPATTPSSGTTAAGAAAAAGTAPATTQPSAAFPGPATTPEDIDPPAAPQSPLGRIWSRLPAQERSQAARTAVESAPPAYRAAIDAYYRLLLQSSPESPPDSPASPPPDTVPLSPKLSPDAPAQ